MLTPLAYSRHTVDCWPPSCLQPSLFSVLFSSTDVHTIKIPAFTENKSFLECIIPFQVLPHFWEMHYREDPHNIFHFPLWSYKQLWAYMHLQLNVHSFLNFFLLSILPFPFNLPPMTVLSSTSVNQLWSEPPVITSIISKPLAPFSLCLFCWISNIWQGLSLLLAGKALLEQPAGSSFSLGILLHWLRLFILFFFVLCSTPALKSGLLQLSIYIYSLSTIKSHGFKCSLVGNNFQMGIHSSLFLFPQCLWSGMPLLLLCI